MQLENMNQYVREKTGFTGVCFVEKEFPPETIIQSVIEKRKNMIETVSEMSETVIANNDLKASNVIYALLKDKIVYSKYTLYYKSNHMWIDR
jgi:hypothetical protein